MYVNLHQERLCAYLTDKARKAQSLTDFQHLLAKPPAAPKETNAIASSPRAPLPTIPSLRKSLQVKPLKALSQRIFALEGEHWAEIDPLLEGNRLAEFNHIFKAIKRLPDPQQAEPLASLATQIGHLPEKKRWTEFDRIFNAVEPLPDPQQIKLLTSLAKQLDFLPKADRSNKFHLILETAVHLMKTSKTQLPDTSRAALNFALQEKIDYLPGHTRHQARKSLEQGRL